ncbi:MAG: acyltransferase family protein [Deltaproteobacteria bacterium]|nr:acyltransferase family protein [Deltaproteobacteria bacterium]
MGSRQPKGEAVLVQAVADTVLTRFLERYVAEDFESRLRTLQDEVGELGVDPFGFDPQWLRYAAPFAWFLHRIYFRTEATGLQLLPPSGRVLFVANHSGQIPLDGMMIATTMLLDAQPPRIVRSMLERWVPTLPFVSIFMARCGQVVGSPENCQRLLEQEEAILVFPEGIRGISKTWRQRYQLQPFGQGFMRLALQTKTPIVPVAVIGAEEQAPTLLNARPIARLLGLPSFPITPTFPLLFPIGMLPLPVKYRLHFGKPLSFEGDQLDDDEVIGQKVDEVREALRRLIRQGLKERDHIFW